jgi:hypothetical protein
MNVRTLKPWGVDKSLDFQYEDAQLQVCLLYLFVLENIVSNLSKALNFDIVSMCSKRMPSSTYGPKVPKNLLGVAIIMY